MTELVTKNNVVAVDKNTTELVDNVTGEILSSNTEIKETKHISYDQFVQVYLNDMKGLMKISSKSEFWVTLWLWKLSSFMGDDDDSGYGNMIIINGAIRAKITAETELSDGSIRNTVTKLAKKKILVKAPYKATYYLNPKYFFKGRLSQRVKSYKRIQEYLVSEEEIKPNTDF